jgi:glycosyltransferase involved in cell wall biosynthesis
MKILMVNKFFWFKGGSERIFFEEAEVLKNKGHTLIFFSMRDERNLPSKQSGYFIDHVDYNNIKSFTQGIKQSLNILYSLEAKRKIKRILNHYRPDIVHLHNIHHQISPSILHAIDEHGIPMVMTLHDYKMVCPVYSLLSNGRPCQKCGNRRYYWCILKRCSKNSYTKSLLNTVEMYLHHSIWRIYNKVQVFIAPSVFLNEKIREMGFKGKVVRLPNFVKPENFKPVFGCKQRSIVYFGRLSPEKGIATLMNAVKGMNITLKIIGDGPSKDGLADLAKRDRLHNVIFYGYKDGSELRQEIRSSMFSVLPSECYENNPLTIIEAFALGKPVIGSSMGGIPELIRDGERGLIFKAGDVGDLRKKISDLLDKTQKVYEMGINARKFVENELNPEKHYEQLMKIYSVAINKGNSYEKNL